MKRNSPKPISNSLEAAVHKLCIQCAGGEDKLDDHNCKGIFQTKTEQLRDCMLYSYRKGETEIPRKIIIKFCASCRGDRRSIKNCPDMACPLHLYRCITPSKV